MNKYYGGSYGPEMEKVKSFRDIDSAQENCVGRKAQKKAPMNKAVRVSELAHPTGRGGSSFTLCLRFHLSVH